MPLFTFKCQTCNCVFEKLLSSWSNENPDCPLCEGLLERELSKPTMFCSDGPREASKKATTPIDTHGIIKRYAHVADRNTGKSLGYAPAGVINENDFH